MQFLKYLVSSKNKTNKQKKN